MKSTNTVICGNEFVQHNCVDKVPIEIVSYMIIARANINTIFNGNNVNCVTLIKFKRELIYMQI